MPRDGLTGGYSLPAGNPYVNGTIIDETVVNATLSDIGTALSNSIAKDGQTTVTANIPMGGNKLTNVAAGSAANQNPIISQIQDGSLLTLGSVSGTDTITGALTPAIVAYTARMLVTFTPANNGTGAATIAINGLAAKAIVKGNAAALVAGDLVTTAPAIMVYDGTAFVLLNPQHNVANDEITFARMQNIASDRLIGRDTASSGDPEEITVSGGLEWTGAGGIQRSALTGEVGATAGSNSLTIVANAVINTKLGQMAQATVKGRQSGAGTGDPQDLTAAQLVTVINTADGTGTGLDSDLLDGQEGTFYRDASNLNAGSLPDARVQQSNVTQHQAALSIAETQIVDGAILARLAANETVSGRWNFSGQPAVSARRSTGSQSLSSGAATDMTFPTEDTDVGSGFNGATGIFTAPATGVYFFTCGLVLTNNTAGNAVLNSVYFSRNNASSGTADRHFIGQPVSSGANVAAASILNLSGSAIMALTASDTLRIKVDIGGSNALTGDIGSRFGGYMLA